MIKQLQNKKIAFLGFGIENQALIKYLVKKKVKCEMTICDARPKEKLGGKYLELNKENAINWQLGKNYNKHLDQFDILFRSPGWPIFCPGIQEALKVGCELSSPMKLFFNLCPTKNIIGVTGTKGKGTTSSLIYAILKKAKKRVWLGGNIGTAPFEFLEKIKKTDWVVLELSSFQLEDLTASPRIAVITNFYKEHLAPADPHNPNYHRTLRGYLEAKLNIVRWQKRNDYAISNFKIQISNDKQIPKSKFQISKLASKLIYFKKSDLPSKLIGEHNKENIAAAVEVAKIAGVGDAVIKKAVAGFKGLEHRLEFVKEINGVKYYNDSFATTLESSITALRSFSQPIILLAGGADKGADFRQFAREIKKRVKFVVLLDGKATPRLKKDLQNAGFENKRMKSAKNISGAVSVAREKASAGDVILLSTACASFGMFKNYKERGRLFKYEVSK